jgi:hypothetical protein
MVATRAADFFGGPVVEVEFSTPAADVYAAGVHHGAVAVVDLLVSAPPLTGRQNSPCWFSLYRSEERIATEKRHLKRHREAQVEKPHPP